MSTTATLAEPVEITGSVTRFFKQSAKFTAGVMTSKGRDVRFSLKGYIDGGQPVTLSGDWSMHPTYGRQFEATEVIYRMPVDPEGLEKWLRNNVEGIGPMKASQLISEFGASFPRLLIEDPQQVAAVGRLPIECVTRLASQWAKDESRISAISQLLAWGFSQSQSEILMGRCGAGVIQMIKSDPYQLIGFVDGFGWEGVDAIGARFGITGAELRRVKGAIVAVVRDHLGEGSSAINYETAWAMAGDKLSANVALHDIHEAIFKAVEAKQLVAVGSDWLALPGLYRQEVELWRIFATATKPNPVPCPMESREWFRANYGTVRYRGTACTLDEGQLGAVIAAASNRIVTVTGGAGAGKTLVASAIAKYFDDRKRPVFCCAPTGKAARRLTEVLGREASTIHRLLGYLDGHFSHDANNPFENCVILLDEVSMCGVPLLFSLLSACASSVSVVMIGDPNQLAPVEAGYPLRDIIAHDLTPIAPLSGCHRQAGPLKENCLKILNGTLAPWIRETQSPWIVSTKAVSPEACVAVVTDLYAKHLPAMGFDPVKDTQFMTAKHDGPYGTTRVNLILQRLHQAKLGKELPEIQCDDHKLRPAFHVGDKVIQTVNNYELDVMNGAIGTVVSTYPFIVEFEGNEVQYKGKSPGEISLGYCLTAHKMQGSEVPCAVVICPSAHSFMMNRNWLYTAVTRAKQTAILLGDDRGLNIAVAKQHLDKRTTSLRVFSVNPETQPQ